MRHANQIAVAVAHDRFEHDADGDGQTLDIGEAEFLQGGQTKKLAVLGLG